MTGCFPWDPCKNDTEKTEMFADCIVNAAENVAAKTRNNLGNDKPSLKVNAYRDVGTSPSGTLLARL